MPVDPLPAIALEKTPSLPAKSHSIPCRKLERMPELPEVETIARGLDKRIAGDIIESVWLGEKPQPLKSSAAEIAAVLEHSRIIHVRRAGKHIVFDLEGQPEAGKRRPRLGSGKRERTRETAPTRGQWIVHLGMTGQLLIGPPEAECRSTRMRC